MYFYQLFARDFRDVVGDQAALSAYPRVTAFSFMRACPVAFFAHAQAGGEWAEPGAGTGSLVRQQAWPRHQLCLTAR